MHKIIDVKVNGLLAEVSTEIEELLTCSYEQTIYTRQRRRILRSTDLKLYERNGDRIVVGLGAVLFLAKNNPFYRFKINQITPTRKYLDHIDIPEKLKALPKWLVNGQERWYFHEALEVCRNQCIGYIKLPTGSGKSSIILTLAYYQFN
jgi:hypothetical protein